MKRIALTLAIAALALPALAQDDFNVGEVTLGLVQRDSDTISSKFLEYRDIPNGGVADLVRFQGKNGDFRYDIWGKDITQGDQTYRGLIENGTIRFEAKYTQIPHAFGNGGATLLTSVTETQWLLSDDLQNAFQRAIEALPSRNYNTVYPIVAPSLAEGRSDINVALKRNRTSLSFAVTPQDSSFDVEVSYAHERRSGTRGNNGTAFGFNNVIETAEPVRYITQDFGVNASFDGKWGVGHVGVRFSDFADKFDTFLWDNPFRVTDSTSSNAYLGPYSTTAGPKQGLAALPPSNQAWNAFGGGTFKLGDNSRLTADVAFGQWKQDEQRFIPFTINSAVFLPDGHSATDPGALPATNLDGKIDTLAFNGFFTTRVAEKVRLNARYRYYDNDNKTGRIRFEEGYTRFDAVWEEIPRINVPYGYTSNMFDVYATFDAGDKVGVEVGYKHNTMDRTFRETESTNDNTYRAAIDVRSGIVLLRGLYELSKRDFDHYDAIHAEHASFLDAGAPANQPTLRRYDQAKRDRNRFGGTLQVSPESGKVTLIVSYFLNKDEYDTAAVPFEVQAGSEPPLGLQEAKYQTFTVEGDFAPSDRATFYAFFSRENNDDSQIGRQSGGSLSFDTSQNWTSTVEDRVSSFGAGADFVLAPDKWNLNVFARWQEVDGNNAFTRFDSPEDIAAYDDTKLLYVSAQLKYQIAQQWALGFGGFFEDYEIDDAQTGNGQILNYMPGSFFLNTNNGDYQAWVGYVNLTYSWQ